jgi:DNA-binding MarR family transcriptional regulator
MPTDWLTPSEMDAWMAFINTVEPLRAALDADLQPHGLTLGDYEVLAFLSEAPERSMRMTDLAQRLRLSPSGLTRRLDGLVRAGHVERHSCASDRRVMYAALTDAGLAFLEGIAPDHVDSVRRHFLAGLDADDLAAVARVFATIRSRLDGSVTVPG